MVRGDGDGENLSQADVSVEEQDKLVAEMMRYMLFKNHQHPGVPVKREELTQLVTKNYRQRNLPNLVITQAQKKFASIFGYEMKELQRSRPSRNNSVRSSQQSTTEAKSYILKSMLPEELRTRFVEDKGSSQLLGLTFVVVGILQLAGGKIPEDTLWQHLRRLGLDEHDEGHPVFGNVKQAMETIAKQRYIQKEKVSGQEGDMTVYELAERALDEVVGRRLKESIMQIVKKDIPIAEASEAGT
uniref:MAGE domain-containing protein n=1 Tax=Araucaria cunninghamii TaxID=56994 RepID=A0A0D6R228_ARACU